MTASTHSALSALLKKSTLDDHEQLLEASNKALKTSKSDLEAQHVKVVALVKLDRYDDAVTFIEGHGAALRQQVALEYAYALYKVGRLDEAAEIASKTQGRGAQHVQAQAKYRLEDSSAVSELYKRIRAEEAANEEFDLRVNQAAIDAQSYWLGAAEPNAASRPSREDLEAFETAYNAACGSIARGEYAQAEILLKRAKELCRHSDDLTEQQKADELLPISVQQLFVLLSLGKTTEAEALAHEIRIEDATDISTQNIGQSNILLSTPAQNPYLAHKTFHSAPRIPLEDRLFSYQKTTLDSNKSTLDLQTFKFDGIVSSTAKKIAQSSLASVQPESTLPSFFNAAAHARNEKGKPAIRKVLPGLQKRPNDVGLIITLVQLYVLCGDITSAVQLVETFAQRLENSTTEGEQETRFSPMLVSLLVSLYRRRGQKAHVKQELAKAASYWKTKPNAPTTLLIAAGTTLLESQSGDDAKLAAEMFSKLRQQQPNEKATRAGYVASHALADETSRVQSDADKLTPTGDLIRNIDINALERNGIPQSSNALAIAQLGRSRKRAAADGANAKSKRVRKSRLPKDYEEGKKADPERWLPMRDRSYYRPPKGKKKNKRSGGDTQGGAVNEDLNIDKPAAAPVVSGSGGGGNKKKKAGKGKK